MSRIIFIQKKKKTPAVRSKRAEKVRIGSLREREEIGVIVLVRFGVGEWGALHVARADDIVDFMNDAIGGNNITFRNASILDLWSTVAVQAQIHVVHGFHQTHEWPFRFNDASAAKSL